MEEWGASSSPAFLALPARITLALNESYETGNTNKERDCRPTNIIRRWSPPFQFGTDIVA